MGGTELELELIKWLLKAKPLIYTPVGDDLACVRRYVQKYENFPLGFTDSAVVCAAEAFKTCMVASLDRRHFLAVVSRLGPLTLLP